MQRKSLKWNTLANLVSRIGAAILSIIAVPIFVRILGAEAYGLVGLFASLQVVFTILDLGLSATVNREIAQNIARNVSSRTNNDLLRTFEIIYWTLGLVIGLIIVLSANWIAINWVNIKELTVNDVRNAMIVMAVAFVAQWPVSLYSGVLRGLQEQVIQNSITLFAAVIRTLGAILTLGLLSNPTISAFLIVQVCANLFEVTANMFTAWHFLRRQSLEEGRFQTTLLKQVWRFALSFNMVGVFGMIASSADRLIISKFLALDQLGYYTVASTAAGAMPLVGNAVSTAIFPRFAALSAVDDKEAALRNFRTAMQAITFVTAAPAVAVTFFAYDILVIWTQSNALATAASTALALLSVAGFFNAIQTPAYSMLIASGNTKIPLAVNIVNIVIFIPLMLVSIPQWGITAAAAIWLAQNMVAFGAYLVFARRLVLKIVTIRPFVQDVAVYVGWAGIWLGGARLILPETEVSFITLAKYLVVGSTAYLLSASLSSRLMKMFPDKFVNVPGLR